MAVTNPLLGPSDIGTNLNRISHWGQSGTDAQQFDPDDLAAWKDYYYDRFKQGDDAAGEKLFNYVASEQSQKNSLDWTAQREDTQYQRLMEDLRKAGISPYVITGATPASSSASFVSHSGSQMTSSDNNNRSSNAQILAAFLRMIGLGIIAGSRLGS